jgi:hypothetical protein
MIQKWVLLITVLLAFGIAPVFAQTTDNPLLQMLARIPDSPSAREYLTYVDYRALIAARPGAPVITSSQQLAALVDSKSKDGRLVMAALYGLKSGPTFFANAVLPAGSKSQEVVGFDLFAIQRAAEFGKPPDLGDVLEGDFDAQAVTAAHEKRGYTATDVNGLTLLCPAAGCDSGLQLDMSQINNANPFGGNIGRNQPVLVGDKLIASAPTSDTINAIASATAGKSPTLAEQVDYHAAAEAISANGTLIQTYFINPMDIGSASNDILNSRLSPDQIKTRMSQLQADFVPMPAYNLIALADSATDSEQQAMVALVYTTQADAQAAAALFPKHLQDYKSLAIQKPMNEVLQDRGVTAVEASVYPASTNRYVTVVRLHAPLPSNAIPANETMPQASSLVYTLLVRAYMSRDLGWLATQF